MSQTIRTLLYGAGLLALAVLWLGYCHDPQVRATEKLRSQTHATDSSSHQTDSRVARLAADSFQREQQLARLDASLRGARGEIARLRHSVIPTDSLPHFADSLPDSLIADAFRRDTLEDQQDSVIANQLSELTIWKALAQERGDLLKQALQERDGYRAIIAQQKPSRFACVAGVGATVGWGQGAGITLSCGLRIH